MKKQDAKPDELPLHVKIATACFIFILLAPIIVYVDTFGFVITSNHARWAEMGAAMSGIYSPLIALLALLVVYRQLKSQNIFNSHEMEQRGIEHSRADIQYYLEQLDRVLQMRDSNGSTVRDMLHQNFLPTSKDQLEKSETLALGQKLNRQYPQPLALWSAIYPHLAGFQAVKRFPYVHNATGTVQKMIAMTTFETGVALDNYHHCVTQGRVPLPYQFSPLVRTEE